MADDQPRTFTHHTLAGWVAECTCWWSACVPGSRDAALAAAAAHMKEAHP